MIPRINLLPHREMRRERRKKEFVSLAVLTVIATAGVALLGGFAISERIDRQNARNEFIKAENAKLDAQIREIATLRQEIEGLLARQRAVESLQADRTIPVHVLDELVRQTPEGLFMKSIRQDDKRLRMTGYAQSNERISDLLRNLANNTPWLERPELMEIKAVTLGKANTPEAKRVFEFSLNALVKSPGAPEAVNAGGPAAPRAPAPKAPAAPTTSVQPAPLAAAGAAAGR